MCYASFTALEKIDLDVVAERALEVQLLHGCRRFVGGRVRHRCFAQADLLARLVEPHRQLARLHSAILGAHLLQLLLTQLNT